MHELMVPEMKRAMQQVGIMLLREIDGAGSAIAMMTEMETEGSLARTYRFYVDECSTVEKFMASAKQRICERVREGATVVLVATTVLMHERGGTMQKCGSLEEARRRLTESGIEVLPGVAVFAVNRREHASELYSRTGAQADKIREQSGDDFARTLRTVSGYLFSKLPWPMMN